MNGSVTGSVDFSVMTVWPSLERVVFTCTLLTNTGHSSP